MENTQTVCRNKEKDKYNHVNIWSKSYSTVAIGNPKQHVRKASHCGSKQQ